VREDRRAKRPLAIFNGYQAAAGRILLNWSRATLAARVRIPEHRLSLFEKRLVALTEAEHEAIAATFKAAGVIAIAALAGGEGVRLARPSSPWFEEKR
jgi:hypothetical protein